MVFTSLYVQQIYILNSYSFVLSLTETKASAPPVYDFYQDPYNPRSIYSPVNEQHANPVSVFLLNI